MHHHHRTDTTTLAGGRAFTPDPDCLCGCQYAGASSGEIVSSDRCPGSSVWIVTAPSGHIVALTFHVYQLDASNPYTKVSMLPT